MTGELTDKQKKVVEILAKAATENEFAKLLQDEPTATLNREGLEGTDFYLPDEKAIRSIYCILRCLGDVIEKRS